MNIPAVAVLMVFVVDGAGKVHPFVSVGQGGKERNGKGEFFGRGIRAS